MPLMVAGKTRSRKMLPSDCLFTAILKGLIDILSDDYISTYNIYQMIHYLVVNRALLEVNNYKMSKLLAPTLQTT